MRLRPLRLEDAEQHFADRLDSPTRRIVQLRPAGLIPMPRQTGLYVIYSRPLDGGI